MASILVSLVIGLGGMLLQALFTPKPKDQYGSRLSDINVTPVAPGTIIPRVWGTIKVNAQMIFASPLIETMHTHQASKKGGGKGLFGGNTAKTYTFTYSIDGAWGICGGPVYRINHIWANQKLVYVDPVVQESAQATFDAAYQSEATYLIDEQGVSLDYAAASSFVFAFNNYGTTEVTLSSPADAVTYIMAHPIDDTGGVLGGIVTPNHDKVVGIIDQLYSGLNNQDTYESQVNRFDQMELYLGDELQVPNSLLEGYLGQGMAPAFRGCAYFVMTNLQLMDFGNQVPRMTVEVQRTPNGTTSLIEILTDVCYQAGLQDGQFDAKSNVDGTAFPGFCVTTNTSARQIIQDLQKVFSVDSAESGFQIIFSMLNSRATQVLRRADLGAHSDTDPLPPSEEVTRVSDYDLPYRINLHFQEPARAFSPNMLYAARYNTPSQSVEDIEVTIALDRPTAQTSVNNTLQNRLFARRVYKWKLPRKYITLEPTDVVKMPNKQHPNFLDQYYCTELQVGANGLLEAQFIDHFYIDETVKATDQTSTDLDAATATDMALPSNSGTVAFLLDCPLLSDTDVDSPGFYTVLAGAFNGWQGGALYVDAAAATVSYAYGLQLLTAQSGSSWEAVAASMINVPHGVVVSGFLAPAMEACYFDRLSNIIVNIFNAMDLQSASETDMLVQPLNATWIGGEIVQYASATSLGNNLWRLKNFLRGQRGTERLINGHAEGESFVRLTSGLNRVLTQKSELNVADSFQALTNMSPNTSATPFSFTDTGNSLRPYTVKVDRIFRDSSGNFFVSWKPRVRTGGQWLAGADVVIPANDTPETYEVDVLTAPGGTVKKTYSMTGALGVDWEYTTAMQTTDFGAPVVPAYIAIYQISTIVGRGFGLGITI